MTVAPASNPDTGAYTGTGFFAVRTMPEQWQLMIAQFGCGVLLLFGVINLAIPLLLAEFIAYPSILVLAGALTIGLGAMLGVLGRWFPGVIVRRFAAIGHSVVVIAGLLITVGLASVGSTFSYAAVLYLIAVIFAVFLMRPLTAGVNVFLMGIGYAIVVTFEADAPFPVFQWG